MLAASAERESTTSNPAAFLSPLTMISLFANVLQACDANMAATLVNSVFSRRNNNGTVTYYVDLGLITKLRLVSARLP